MNLIQPLRLNELGAELCATIATIQAVDQIEDHPIMKTIQDDVDSFWTWDRSTSMGSWGSVQIISMTIELDEDQSVNIGSSEWGDKAYLGGCTWKLNALNKVSDLVQPGTTSRITR